MTQIKNEKIKDCYDSLIGDRYDKDYEFNRWFNTARDRLDYTMTYRSVSHSIKNTQFSSCLEGGPGPGTWTRVIYRENPNATFQLVDISKAMEDQFELEMRKVSNVEYTVGDISEFMKKDRYDLFFSSRMIEYLEDKALFAKNLYTSLRLGGRGVIITKNPKYGLFSRKDSRFQHTGQLSSGQLVSLLGGVGFRDIETFPVVIRVPLLDRASLFLSEKIFNNSFKKPLCNVPLSLVESYLVTFKK